MIGPRPEFGTISDLSRHLADGTQTAETLLAACLANIEAQDAGLSAMLQLNPHALADARALDAQRARTGTTRSKLHGIPVVLKDNIDMEGLPTTSGNLAMARAMPLRDSAQVKRLRAAGAVIVGKTNLSEFSFEIRSLSSLGGNTRNPFNREVTAGGSSGGSAAAVAAGFAVAALGTDTGGSIRVPAAYNGLVGLRPTHGWIDNRGIAPLAPSTDTVGPIARCVADIAHLLGVMADTTLPAGALSGARLGVLRQAFGDDPQIGAALQQALRIMSEAGAVLIDPVALPADMLPERRPHVVDWEFRFAFDDYLASHFLPGTAPASIADILASGAYLPEHRAALERRVHRTSLEHHPTKRDHLSDKDARQNKELEHDPIRLTGSTRSDHALDAPEYRAILAFHREMKTSLLTLMDNERLDALVYPTSMVTPHSLENPSGGWAPELAANSGFPALTLPVGQANHGPFIGLELLTRANTEPLLLGLGADLEERLKRLQT